MNSMSESHMIGNSIRLTRAFLHRDIEQKQRSAAVKPAHSCGGDSTSATVASFGPNHVTITMTTPTSAST